MSCLGVRSTNPKSDVVKVEDATFSMLYCTVGSVSVNLSVVVVAVAGGHNKDFSGELFDKVMTMIMNINSKAEREREREKFTEQ